MRKTLHISRTFATAALLLGMLLLATASGAQAAWRTISHRTLSPLTKQLAPLHENKRAPKPGDWLDLHGNVERGQTFREYIRSRPVLPTHARSTLYILPLGEFTPGQKRVLNLTADYLSTFYGLPVQVLPQEPLSLVPEHARRTHPQLGNRQMLSTYILDKVLAPRLPRDGALLFGITNADLWPGGSWDYVFGQANTRRRTGVQSLYRNGDADGTEREFLTCLRRTLKTATHESGHMFSMLHCIQYECNMNGSNSRQESDEHPMHMCPECMAKVCWAMQLDPVTRYQTLAIWTRLHGLDEEADFYVQTLERLDAAVPDAARAMHRRIAQRPLDPSLPDPDSLQSLIQNSGRGFPVEAPAPAPVSEIPVVDGEEIKPALIDLD